MIVEILNLSSNQIDSVMSQTCLRFNPAHVIGMRYFAIVKEDNYEKENIITVQGWNHGIYDTINLHPKQVRIIKINKKERGEIKKTDASLNEN